jgi:hypothetical protein
MKLLPAKSTLCVKRPAPRQTKGRTGKMSVILSSRQTQARQEATRSIFLVRDDANCRPRLPHGTSIACAKGFRVGIWLGILQGAVGMGAASGRAIVVSGLIALVTAGVAAGQTTARPPVGGVGSPPDAMIFYVAHGAVDACGKGCSDWIAAEGAVQFDTNRRLIAILDRQAGHKLPVVIHTWGGSNLNTATKLGRILRDRGVDATAGATDVEACHDKPDADCFALKRPGGPLDARIEASDQGCDNACVLMLAGAVHRSLPPTTRVILTGTVIHNRLAPNVSEEEREGATAMFGQQFRVYLREMGIQIELLDIIDRNSASRQATELPPSEWIRLGIVTSAP